MLYLCMAGLVVLISVDAWEMRMTALHLTAWGLALAAWMWFWNWAEGESHA